MKSEHIILYGERKAGKSTLITNLLASAEIPIYGFVTKRLGTRKDGLHPIYIFDAQEYMDAQKKYPQCKRGEKLPGLVYDEYNLIAMCDGKLHEPNLDAFNGLGVSYIRKGLEKLQEGGPGVIVMDELGFLESRAELFRDTVTEALNSDCRLLVGLKKYPEAEFTRMVYMHERSTVYEITPDNREELRARLDLSKEY